MPATKTKLSSKKNSRISPTFDLSKEAEAAYQQFLPFVLKLNQHEIRSFPIVDIYVAYYNVKQGVQAIEPRISELKAMLSPNEVKSILELPVLALATVFAYSQATHATVESPKGLSEKLAQVRKHRRILLNFAKSYASIGLLPESEVRSIQKGTGAVDSAQDCIDLAALFRRHHDLLKNKTPIDDTLLQEASALGTELLTLIRPTGAMRASASSATKQIADIRDRFWSLLSMHHEILWKAGAILFGKKAVDALVPSLLSRTKRSGKKQEAIVSKDSSTKPNN